MNFADQRVLKSTPATLSAQFVDQDGVAHAASGVVTVGITRADGSILLAAGTTTSGPTGVGIHSVALTAAQTATLDHLTCTWTSTVGGESVVTHVDVVGGFGFTLADMTGLDGMSGLSKERQRDLRQAVEELVEERTGWLWTRRLVVESFTATCWQQQSIRLNYRPFKTLTSVKVDGVAQTLSYWPFGEWGRLETEYFPSVSSSTSTHPVLEVIYEAGENRPPVSLVQALLDAARQNQLDRTSGAKPRVLSEVNEFGNINYARATAENLFGNPAVDAVLGLWDRRMPAIA